MDYFQITSPVSALDQKWQETVSSQVIFGDQRQGRLENYSKEDYRFSETITKIQDFQAQGKSICLFIGRTPYEKLPTDLNEAKENEIWISADFTVTPTEHHEEGTLKEVPTLNNHLWLDFNQQEGLDLIKGLFDKIVIDQSTVKGFHNDFAKRFACLLHNSESEMIFENPSTFSYVQLQEDFFNPSSYLLKLSSSVMEKRINANYLKYQEDHAKEEIEEDKKNFLKEKPNLSEMDEDFELKFMYSIAMPSNESLFTKAAACFKEHLKSIYNTVEEYEDTEYPYKTNWGGSHYFVVRDPKNLTNSTLNNFAVDYINCCNLF